MLEFPNILMKKLFQMPMNVSLDQILFRELLDLKLHSLLYSDKQKKLMQVCNEIPSDAARIASRSQTSRLLYKCFNSMKFPLFLITF